MWLAVRTETDSEIEQAESVEDRAVVFFEISGTAHGDTTWLGGGGFVRKLGFHFTWEEGSGRLACLISGS